MKMLRISLFKVILFCHVSIVVKAQTNVWFFRDATNPGYYDSGLAFKTSPSTVEQTGPSGDKIPTESTIVYQGSNSLRLRWTSRTGGDWLALVIAPGFPFQDISQTDTLAFWAYAPAGMLKTQMPKIFMEVAPGSSKTKKYSIGDYVNDLPTATWIELKIPLRIFFNDAGNSGLNFSQTKAIIFGQNTTDDSERLMYIDNVRTYRGSAAVSLSIPTGLTATGYDSHIDLDWEASTGSPEGYQIWRSSDNGLTFSIVKTTSDTATTFVDFIKNGKNAQSYKYKIKAVASGIESNFSSEATGTLKSMTDEELLTMVQRYTFRYFWEFGHPVSGMARERNNSNDVVTIGGTGFGVMAIIVAVERGFITRTEGVARLLKMVNFLSTADKFHGVFPHWMNGTTGKTIPFSTYDNGGDLVETSFLIQGLLTVRQYFNQNNTDETQLRAKIKEIWEGVEWDWYRQSGQNVLYWHWSPNYAWRMNFALRGYYEALITYVLAVASPKHSIPASIYHQGWAGSPNYINNQSYYGYKLFVGPLAGGPLFFAHYSYLGFDPRNKKDAYANYFLHNTNQSLINWAYCKNNPKKWKGYSADCWGLTASDDPFGYLAHEPFGGTDNGTIAPTAALSSMPYTPKESMAALKHFYRNLGDKIWSPMGFTDAFNETQNWYATSTLAIDQGPIICMIENHRTGLLWKHFMQSPEIQPALNAIGFTPDSTTSIFTPSVTTDFSLRIFPNPLQENQVSIEFDLNNNENLSLDVLDMNGRVVHSLFKNRNFNTGKNQTTVDMSNISNGFYLLQLRGGHFIKQQKFFKN